jgi:hypothetical protein
MMTGYVIQIDATNFLNWQGLGVEDIAHAVLITSRDEADTLAAGYQGARVIEQEMTSDNSPVKMGTFFAYHAAIG